MKLRTVFSTAIAIIFAFSLMTAQTKDNVVKKTTEKKSECPMHGMKADSKDAQKCEGKSKDCCKKEGKMSDKCSGTDKAKCDMSKSGKSDCCKDKTKKSNNK